MLVLDDAPSGQERSGQDIPAWMEELPGWDERLLSFKNDLMLVFDVEHGSERYQQVGFTRMPHLELVGQMVLIAAAVARYTRSSRRW